MDLTLHPEAQRLSSEIEILKEEITKLTTELEQIVAQEVPRAEALYMQKIGSMKYEQLQLECQVLRLKRKVALIQASINRSMIPDEQVIDTTLDGELSQWTAELEAFRKSIVASRKYLSLKLLSAEESLALRNTFRRIAKKLHPDLHSSLSEENKNLWHRAVEAHRTADLNGLLAIGLLVEDVTAAADFSGLSDLAARKKTLVGLVHDYHARIAKLRGEFPCNLREKLEDEAWLAEELRSMNSRKALLQAEKLFFEDTVCELLKGNKDAGRTHTH